MADYCDLTVVAPVNIVQNPRFFRDIPQRENLAGMSIYHPRFGVIPGMFKHWDGELLFRQTMYQIRGTIPLEQYDLVDVHYAYPDGVAGQRLAQEMRKPFVISLRGSDIHVLTRFPKRRRLIQEMLRQASAIVAVSKALKREAETLGADLGKIHVIPNGVDTTIFFPWDQGEARHRLGWPLDAYVVLSVGRLVPVKGFDLLIRAIKEVRARLKKTVRCYIVGEGESRPTLEREIKRLRLEKEIILSGRILPQDLPLWYSAADLFCLLSHSEGCPNVVLESLACGTPVVATDVGGVPEMVREGATGLFMKSRNEEEVAYQIEKALKIKWNQDAIRKSETVQDWSEVARAHMQLLDKVGSRS